MSKNDLNDLTSPHHICSLESDYNIDKSNKKAWIFGGNLITMSAFFFYEPAAQNLTEAFTLPASYSLTTADACVSIGLSVVALATYLKDVKNSRRESLMGATLSAAQDRVDQLPVEQKDEYQALLDGASNEYAKQTRRAKHHFERGATLMGGVAVASIGLAVALAGTSVVPPLGVAVGILTVVGGAVGVWDILFRAPMDATRAELAIKKMQNIAKEVMPSPARNLKMVP